MSDSISRRGLILQGAAGTAGVVIGGRTSLARGDEVAQDGAQINIVPTTQRTGTTALYAFEKVWPESLVAQANPDLPGYNRMARIIFTLAKLWLEEKNGDQSAAEDDPGFEWIEQKLDSPTFAIDEDIPPIPEDQPWFPTNSAQGAHIRFTDMWRKARRHAELMAEHLGTTFVEAHWYLLADNTGDKGDVVELPEKKVITDIVL